jgi:hypothetical protein
LGASFGFVENRQEKAGQNGQHGDDHHELDERKGADASWLA